MTRKTMANYESYRDSLFNPLLDNAQIGPQRAQFGLLGDKPSPLANDWSAGETERLPDVARLPSHQRGVLRQE